MGGSPGTPATAVWTESYKISALGKGAGLKTFPPENALKLHYRDREKMQSLRSGNSPGHLENTQD